MKAKFLLTFTLFGFISFCSGQDNSAWNRWNWLIGNWKGEGSGQPGQGSGTFSFFFDLDKNVIVRRSHSEYPATESKPQIIHDDLMIVYPDPADSLDKAMYFDNEGHTINYTISYLEKSIILTSDKIPDSPIFRLVYTLLDNETINTRFEMSQDGYKFMPYVEGKSKKQAESQTFSNSLSSQYFVSDKIGYNRNRGC
jgi:hypothetical protein